MDFDLTAQERAFQQDVRNFLSDHLTPELNAEVWTYGRNGRGPLTEAFYRAVADRGWTSLTWPREYGGLGAGAIYQLLMTFEFEYAFGPRVEFAWTGLAPTIIRFGTDRNRQMWLDRIRSTEVSFTLGYSEPEAGTDLASLRTSAVRDGADWVINGEKLWNSEAHFATHEWLVVRTNPELPRHRGLSLMIVALDSPGIEVFPVETWPGVRTNRTVFTDVRVPAENLIGEVDKGWDYVVGALDFERATIGGYVGSLYRLVELLIEYANTTELDGRCLADDPIVRQRLAELSIDVEMARLMSLEVAHAIDHNLSLTLPATAQKVFTSELRTKVADVGMQMIGPEGIRSGFNAAVPLGGLLEWSYRWAPVQRFGGGTNEVMRDVIAQRGLNLPRANRGVAT